MKKVLSLVLSVMFHLFIITGNAQNVAINTDGSNADASAMLDVKSTSKGVLGPRMTTAQRTAITAPAAGLQVYDTDTKGFWFYNGTAWAQMTTVSPWAVTGTSIANTNTGPTNINGSDVQVNTDMFLNQSLDVDGNVDFGTGKFLFNNTTNLFSFIGSLDVNGNVDLGNGKFVLNNSTGNITTTGNIKTNGDLTVSSNKGIIRSNTSSQLVYYTNTFNVATGNMAAHGSSPEFSIAWPTGIFASAPLVFVGNEVSSGGTVGELHRVIVVIYDVTATGCHAKLINTDNTAVNYSITYNLSCIGVAN